MTHSRPCSKQMRGLAPVVGVAVTARCCPTPPKAVVLDLDGTLLRSDGTLSPGTIHAIRSTRASNTRVLVATTRTPRAIRRIEVTRSWAPSFAPEVASCGTAESAIRRSRNDGSPGRQAQLLGSALTSEPLQRAEAGWGGHGSGGRPPAPKAPPSATARVALPGDRRGTALTARLPGAPSRSSVGWGCWRPPSNRPSRGRAIDHLSSSESTSPMIFVVWWAGSGSPPSASATSAAKSSTE